MNLTIDELKGMKSLFGGVSNMMRILNLPDTAKASLYRLWRDDLQVHSHNDTLIMDVRQRWQLWRSRFLRDENRTEFTL